MLLRNPAIGVILVGADLWNYVFPISQKYAKNTTAMLLKIPTKSSKTRPIRLKYCEGSNNAKNNQPRESQ